jgi:hypothetical protein
MIIGFSLGCFWKFMNKYISKDQIKNKNSWLDMWRIYESIGEFNAFEIGLTPEDEKHFEISLTNYKWLESLDYLSYHLVEFTDKTMDCIYQLPEIKYFIIHIDKRNDIPIEFLNKYKDKILFENIEDVNIPFKDSDNVCLDFAHAYNYFYDCNFNDKIKQFHISKYDKELKHIPFYRLGEFDLFDGFIGDGLYTNYPVIIESNFDSIDEARKELIFIKEKIHD